MAAEAQQEPQPTTETIPIDEIEQPTYTEKLHPVESEDDEEWESFSKNVGTSPDKEIDVRVVGDTYELIDGDRRARAVEENGGEEIEARVFRGMSDEEFYARRVRANLQRRDNDPVQESWYAAQFVAPWLLPPGERRDVERQTQQEYAEMVGYQQPSISKKLAPMENRHPLRKVIGDEAKEHAAGNVPTEEDIEMVDETIAYLTGQGEHDRVIPRNQEGKAADEIADLRGITLREIHGRAKKAAEEGWKLNTFLEKLDTLADDETKTAPGSIDMGLRNEDTSRTETHDGDPDRVPSTEPPNEEDSDEEPKETINWEEYIDDDQLEGQTVFQLVGQRGRQEIVVNGDIAVALNAIAESKNTEVESIDEAMRDFFGPVIVDEAIDHFAE